MFVGREPKAESELGIVLEQRIRPRRPSPLAVFRPWRNGKVAAVDGGAAGGVGDLRAIAEQLAQQFEIRRLAAAAAGAGKLEQRLQELHAADVAEIHPGAIVHRQRFEEGDGAALRRQQRRLVRHVDGFHVRLARAGLGARLDAKSAARAVLDIELQREAGLWIAAGVDGRRLEPVRRPDQAIFVIIFRPNDAVRTDEAALSALNAKVFAPDRNGVGEVALFERGGARRERAVDRYGADRNLVAQSGENPRGHGADEIRRIRRRQGRHGDLAGDVRRNRRLAQPRQGSVDRREVLVDDRLPLPRVCLADRTP